MMKYLFFIYSLQLDGEQVAGIDTVTAKFVSGHLKSNLLLERSFLYIEKQINFSAIERFLENNSSATDAEWEIVLVDTDIETSIKWCRTNHLLGESIVEIMWSISNETTPGTYRIRHVGYYKVTFFFDLEYYTFII